MRDILKSLAEQVDGYKDNVAQHHAELSEAKFEVEGSAAQAENARTSLGRATQLDERRGRTRRETSMTRLWKPRLERQDRSTPTQVPSRVRPHA